jgi:hypothetical protein
VLKLGQCEALGLPYTVLAPLGLGFSLQLLGNTLSGSTRLVLGPIITWSHCLQYHVNLRVNLTGHTLLYNLAGAN